MSQKYYKVIWAEKRSELEEEVQKYMNAGYQCQGGICVYNGVYYQAMIY